MSGRMWLRLALAAAALAALLLLGGCVEQGIPQASPNAPSSGDLVESPKWYDGDTITFEGEAIGEAMKRGDYAWLHINDDAYYVKNVEEGAALGGYNSGMPVYLPATLAERVSTFGDYKHEGDIVEVEGVYHAACPEHGGDMDIHAKTLRVVTPGHRVVDPVHPVKLVVAAVLAVLAGVLWFLSRRVARQVSAS